MKERSLRLSPKHGVNATVPICFFCGKFKNQIIMAGYIPGDKEAPHGVAWDMEPCDACAELMQQGILLISVKSEDDGSENPYRTGSQVVLKEEAIHRIVNDPATVEHICRCRWAYVPDNAWDLLGLPRASKE